MTKLMENVLIIGRIDSRQYQLHLEPIDILNFCQSYIENILSITSSKIKVNYFFSEDLTNVKADENLLGLILTNLFSNAVKYSGKSDKIDIYIDCLKGKIILIIRDYGIGIPQEDKVHLFNTFYRASNVGNIAGYGLGLYIVKRCIDVYQGLIEIESTVGEGTQFTITLPFE